MRNFGMLPAYLRVALFVTGALALVMIGILAGTAAAEHGRDPRGDVMRGSYLTWSVINGCEDSNEVCEEVLAEVNGDGDGVQFFEDGSSYLTEDGRKYE
jgi:hypothetical protein